MTPTRFFSRPDRCFPQCSLIWWRTMSLELVAHMHGIPLVTVAGVNATSTQLAGDSLQKISHL